MSMNIFLRVWAHYVTRWKSDG